MWGKMIPFSQISVVVQGPSLSPDGELLPGLHRVLSSVRQYLPGAELILSTWNGSDAAAALNPDLLVMSPDPGGMRYRSGHAFENNVNRQIRSTLAGLRQATRPYALKLRSDLELTGTGFLDAAERFPARMGSHRVFQRRVVISSLFTVNPQHGGITLFHPGDWVQFGLTADLLKLWKVPEANEEGLMRWYERHPVRWQELEARWSTAPTGMRRALTRAIVGARQLHESGFACRYAPEQYLWIQALRQTGYAGFQHGFDVDAQTLADESVWMVNNFVLIQARQFSFVSQKYQVETEEGHPRLYTHLEWVRLYRETTGDTGARALRGGIWPHVQTKVERNRRLGMTLLEAGLRTARLLGRRLRERRPLIAA